MSESVKKSDAAQAVDQASDQARFAAREFCVRFERETEVPLSAVVRDRMLFAYEMGYLRGRTEGMRAAGAMYDETQRKVNDDE